MRILIVLLVFLTHCTSKHEPKNILNRVTLKLEKPLSIELVKVGSNPSDFNIVAKVKSVDNFSKVSVTWVLVDQNDVEIFKEEKSFADINKNSEFDSGSIALPNPEQNYKVVFIFSGQTPHEQINKTSIYNTLIQEELNEAIKDLQERAN